MESLNLRQAVEKIKQIKRELECEVWLEGIGDGRVKLCIEEKAYTIL